MADIHAALTSLFGFHAFRGPQEAVIQAILAGRDTFTLMPTGGGKSLCYQLPASLLPGACVVVSPLLSLMKDQVDSARATGLRAAAFNSVTPLEEKQEIRTRLRGGELDLLYVSPERLQFEGFVEFLQSVPLAFFAIDEAHCISQWGHDFRPDYLALSSLAENFPGVAVAAFTATATRRVAQDIMARLGLRDPLFSRASFDRPNLFYQVLPREKLEAQLTRFLHEHPDEPGIIYRGTRKEVEQTAAFLQQKGFNCLPYHAGLPDRQRAAAQDAFRNDTCQIIVATIAFGMGIDKSNVRFVIHGDLPKNLEGYYQETGRAGRDGEPARCVLFHGRKDVAQQLRFIEVMEDEQAREAARAQFYRMLDFTQKEGCRRKQLLAYFGEDYPQENCGGCDICTGEAQREDALVAAQKLLSAMVRTQCRFGANHLIGIVRGSDTQRIRQFGHDRLPTFGVGKEHSVSYWRRVVDGIIAQGLATIPDPSFPVPAITAAGWETLRGNRPFTIVRGLEESAPKARRPEASDVTNPELFLLLRQERTRLAQEGGIPPYMVFSDKSLREMAAFLPDTPDKLLAIHGVGQHKLQTYGEHFMVIIRSWREAQDSSPSA